MIQWKPISEAEEGVTYLLCDERGWGVGTRSVNWGWIMATPRGMPHPTHFAEVDRPHAKD